MQAYLLLLLNPYSPVGSSGPTIVGTWSDPFTLVAYGRQTIIAGSNIQAIEALGQQSLIAGNSRIELEAGESG